MKGGSVISAVPWYVDYTSLFYQVCEHKAGLDGDPVISKYEPHKEFFCKNSALRNDNINRLKSVDIK